MNDLPPLRVGTLGSEALLGGPFARRRELAGRIAAAGIDHLFIPDHVSFHTGIGMDGLINAAILTTLLPETEVCVGVYLLALRHPVPVARQIASICESARAGWSSASASAARTATRSRSAASTRVAGARAPIIVWPPSKAC
ncbi:MAG: hypothetical protein U5R48_18755 [Gammaproteobacteria bacterium]|nr:hypothetical protein [Gammaproteobacteria bacterium]